ncbi:hypothetical protein [Finegoldia magna]|uniref:hypothetical protein n=1 Tax=Finegoldia magna TaxID=1260 RepID=UPI0028FE78D8|nr:hypothetical protein [Finegoldia magna]MDU1212727.1 hypothetical protein [Finegoldia magna]
MKTKIEFTVVENIEKQIKDWKLSDEQIEKYNIKKDEVYKHYIKNLEDVIRKEIEFDDYTIIEDFKATKVEE